MLFKNIYMYCSKVYFSKVYFSKVFIPKMYFSEVYPTSVSSKLCKFIQKVLTVQTLIFSSNPSEFKQIRPHYCLNAVKVYIIKDKQFCLEIWWKWMKSLSPSLRRSSLLQNSAMFQIDLNSFCCLWLVGTFMMFGKCKWQRHIDKDKDNVQEENIHVYTWWPKKNAS